MDIKHKQILVKFISVVMNPPGGRSYFGVIEMSTFVRARNS